MADQWFFIARTRRAEAEAMTELPMLRKVQIKALKKIARLEPVRDSELTDYDMPYVMELIDLKCLNDETDYTDDDYWHEYTLTDLGRQVLESVRLPR